MKDMKDNQGDICGKSILDRKDPEQRPKGVREHSWIIYEEGRWG